MTILETLGLKKVRERKFLVSEREAEDAFNDRFKDMPTSKEPGDWAAMVESSTPEKMDEIEREERRASESQGQRDAKRRRKLVRDAHVSARVAKSVKDMLLEVAKGAGKKTAADGIHIIAEHYAKQHDIDLGLGD